MKFVNYIHIMIHCMCGVDMKAVLHVHAVKGNKTIDALCQVRFPIR